MPFYIIGGLMVLYRYRWAGLWMIVCAVLAIVVSDQSSGFVKHFIHRLRPCATEQVRLLVAHCSDTFSFTSNHAANHFAIAAFLSLVFRRVKWLPYVLIIWAGFVALSQVYVGLHFPADIAGGALIGVLAGYAAFALFKLIKEKYFAESNI
jgi:undecaprenyl-diphosphatase